MDLRCAVSRSAIWTTPRRLVVLASLSAGGTLAYVACELYVRTPRVVTGVSPIILRDLLAADSAVTIRRCPAGNETVVAPGSVMWNQVWSLLDRSCRPSTRTRVGMWKMRNVTYFEFSQAGRARFRLDLGDHVLVPRQAGGFFSYRLDFGQTFRALREILAVEQADADSRRGGASRAPRVMRRCNTHRRRARGDGAAGPAVAAGERVGRPEPGGRGGVGV